VLVKLFPDQIAERWDFIKPAIDGSLPMIADDESPDRMNNILESLLLDQTQCWISSNKGKVNAVVTTKIAFDDTTKTSSLLLYSVYSFGETVRKDWIEAFGTLSKFAESKECSRLIAYTDNEDLIRLSERLGGQSTTFLCIAL